MASVRPAGLVLGLGIGGFIDGIVLHQLLGWHHMLSGWYPDDLRLNMIGDGAFHALCLVLVIAGVAMLSRAAPHRLGELFGWMITGWGLFNVVEGLVDHQILGVHHVRPGPHQLGYDIGFLVFGAALIVAGVLIARASAGRS
ncbi:membrane protein [Thermobispora bispora]|uniref:Conserved hypothetical conserved membrane protein n=1 Tax=Thermobispora bispora (strain ATCC 19993 / DSM 43833 / CBS 139.67 / JCM 10125 / KCTC 9307 / NBRC 14880 / R51) TaxID=469371 RepID=D6YAD5_THEBD|nr:DUF2243 domain-containing protein [Thermobispora bispora]ADG90188.1 conserved hypothetical conserved membrane protein [Thermobispora bispora DSM 43833]